MMTERDLIDKLLLLACDLADFASMGLACSRVYNESNREKLDQLIERYAQLINERNKISHPGGAQ